MRNFPYAVLLTLLAGCGGAVQPIQLDGPTPPAQDGGTPIPPDLAAFDLSGPPQIVPDLATAPDLSMPVLTVAASQNLLALDTCQASPAAIPDIPAGTYTIELASSTLSKGQVGTSPPATSFDNYVIVQLPLGPDDPQEARRFFMLNGIGATASFTLAQPGTVQVMFVDSDRVANVGEATVIVSPGPFQTTVSAATNVLAWMEGCNSNPAEISVSASSHGLAILDSTLSWGTGQHGDYVLLRMPSEVPHDDFRYVILNGVDASHVFNSLNSDTLRGWFISPGGTPAGHATLTLSNL